MYRFTTLLILFVATLLHTTECGPYGRNDFGAQGGRFVGSRNRYIGNQNPQPTIPTSTNPPTAKEIIDRNASFTTFGLISLMVVVIVLSLAFYYAIMCYPLLCKSEKNYNYMDSQTITAATSRSMQSIENFPCDSKH